MADSTLVIANQTEIQVVSVATQGPPGQDGTSASGGGASVHADLVGRDALDSHPASAVSIDDTAIGSGATTVQGALEYLAVSGGSGESSATAASVAALAASIAALDVDLDAHVADPIDAHDASAISIDDTQIGSGASNVQDALEYLALGGGESSSATAASVAALDAELEAHILDAVDAHDASAISIDDSVLNSGESEVQGALEWLKLQDQVNSSAAAASVAAVQANLDAHILDAVDAHDASAISVVDTSIGSGGDDVQEVLEWLAAADDTNASLAASVASDLQAHINDSVDAHDASAISFNDTIASGETDVQGVIEFLSASGIDPYDDTNPTYPGLGASTYQEAIEKLTIGAAATTFVYNSSGTAGGNRYNDWNALMDAIADPAFSGKKFIQFESNPTVRAATGGFFDEVIPVGTYDLSNVTLYGNGFDFLSGSGINISFTGATSITNPDFTADRGLFIFFNGMTVPFMSSSTYAQMTLIDGATVVTSDPFALGGNEPIIDQTAGTVAVIMRGYNCSIIGETILSGFGIIGEPVVRISGTASLAIINDAANSLYDTGIFTSSVVYTSTIFYNNAGPSQDPAGASLYEGTAPGFQKFYRANSAYVGYSPADATDWIDPDPVTAAEALDDLATRISDHEADTVDAHDASAISVNDGPIGSGSSHVQGVLEWLATASGTHASLVAFDDTILGSGETDVQGAIDYLAAVMATIPVDVSDITGLGTAAVLDAGTGAGQVALYDVIEAYVDGLHEDQEVLIWMG